MMKNAIVFFSFICFLAFSLPLKAQEKPYTLQIHTVGNYVSRANAPKFRFEPITGWALQAERKIGRKIGLGLKYSQWLRLRDQMENLERILRPRFTILEVIDEDQYLVGKEYLISRYNFHFIDVYAFYKHLIHPRHQLSLRQSGSFATGFHNYEVIISGDRRTERKSYLGGSTQLSYDYLLWKKRINIGGDIGARYYFGLPYVNFTYEAHIGFNF